MNEQGGGRKCHSYFVAEEKIHRTIEILIVLMFLRGNNWLLLLPLRSNTVRNPSQHFPGAGYAAYIHEWI